MVGGFLVFVLALGYFFYGLQPSFVEKEGPVSFGISKGESFRSIGARLSQEGLVRSISVFKVYALLTGSAQKFQPGMYELASTMSVPELVRALTSVGKNEVAVTIPEGYTLKDIEAVLSKQGVLEEGALSAFEFHRLILDYPFLEGAGSLEGFLFPDTYRFERGSSPDEIVRRFLDTFQAKAWVLLKEHQSWHDRLILASYLEREVPEFQDRRIVAGILLRRLQLGMPLQVDATISYAKCKGRFADCEGVRILRSDLTFVSPYNTYQRMGWTPTPISNPGEAAIKAALNSEKTKYLYYLSERETGITHFSRTLEEHNSKRLKYL
ncbi:hypothetical protein A3A21_00375 [Candidatus Jorgensenbacteria bacterium RIFCSPLOWO2_01_FULL_45_25b]|uniref:Endolytic murein transglycosylase n=1 Tax=Candidatus Jorgensenbacteria bacterium RIFCSPLOWO2_01_FULL_45_25b TaxID=1798471 RepID=A0A1F6BVZ8_9BACT|nr:MAG: hypothetical protein A3A21_00375 [Candidatus Jorgensenbacteria bacterium RIFCSPLOWO2_01_FULL_45_25b]